MKALLPSIAALVAFESAARHGSFTRAAAELNLTQGAISRQIRQLESQLGTALFKRIRQRVTLSDAGRGYLADVRQMLDALEVSTQRAMAYVDGANVLKLAVPPTFSASWLAARLPTFLAEHPGITINCAMRLPWFDYGTETFDCGIYSGPPTLPGLVAQPLIETEVIPVCSAAFRTANRVHAAATLARVPLLHQTNQPTAWADWFAAAGVPPPARFLGPRFEHIAMLTRAAVAGLGVALVPACLVEDELASGRLTALLPESPRNRLVFYLAVPESKQAQPAVRAFVDWIARTAASTTPSSQRRPTRLRRSS
jgi:LysR family transcriptional regulator, glycine cleavage system transcriptional activator